MADELVDKGIDAEELDDKGVGPGRGKVWWVGAGVALVAVVVVVAGTLAITRPWSNTSDDASVVTVARPVDADRVMPELTHQLALGEIPEGYEFGYVNDGEMDGWEENAPQSTVGTNVLLAGPDATSDQGPWLVASVTLLDKFERRDFDPSGYIMAADSKEVRIGELAGAFTGDNFTGNSELVFGPVNDGYMVSLSAEGLTQAELTAAAIELQLDEVVDSTKAWPVFGPSLVPFDMQPVVSFEQQSFGFGIGGPFGLLATATMSSTEVSYESAGEGQQISLVNSVPPVGLDVLALARFSVSDAVETTVHGQPAVTGRIEGFIGGEMVAWLEGGRTVILFSADPDLDVVALAESVGPVDDDVWAEMVDAVNDFDGGFGNGPEDTWLIGVGDTADSTTWVIEGEVDESGDLLLCSTFMRPNESGSGCQSGATPELPGLTPVGDLSFGGGSAVLGFVATVEINTVATLRFTGDDGSVVETPLAEVRAEWPFFAAAVVAEQPGVVEIVGADGTVLVSEEVTQDDLDSGGFG